MEIVVVGGGASGLMAAIEAAGRGRVTVIERCARVGRKLAVTGNGRCNLTNLRLSAENYHGEDRDFPRPALEAFPVRDTLAFFRKLGLVTVAEPSGRVYPHSDQAGSVVDVLRFAALERGVDVLCGVCVREIRREGQGFRVICEDRELTCRYVIVAAGGAAGVRAGGRLPPAGGTGPHQDGDLPLPRPAENGKRLHPAPEGGAGAGVGGGDLPGGRRGGQPRGGAVYGFWRVGAGDL